MITDLRPFFESNVRVSRAAKRARALAAAKDIPSDQFVFTKLTLDAKETGSPKHRDRLVSALDTATAALVGSPLVLVDPDTEDQRGVHPQKSSLRTALLSSSRVTRSGSTWPTSPSSGVCSTPPSPSSPSCKRVERPR